MKRLFEKFGSHFQYKGIKSTLQRCLYDLLSKNEFDECWNNLLDTYDLHDNAWLGSLHCDRQLWVPAYVKDTYWAKMLTTQPSEGMNTFFDDYVHYRTTLK